MGKTSRRISKSERAKIVDDILAGRSTQSSVAAELGVTRQAINNWVRRRLYPEKFAPKPKPKPKPPPRLPATEARQIAKAIRSGPPSKYGLLIEGDEWAPVTVRDLIRLKLGKTVPLPSVHILIDSENLPVPHETSSPFEARRRPGRPRRSEAGVEEVAKPEGEPQMVKADMEFYQRGIDAAHERMAAHGTLGRAPKVPAPGIRVGKHARGGKRRKKKQR